MIFSFGEEKAGLCASRDFARADNCPFSLPFGVRGWLRLVVVALPGHFINCFSEGRSIEVSFYFVMMQ